MARMMPRSVSKLRQLILALLTIGLVLRLGGTCDAMAARAVAPAAHQAHCADMPAKPGKPVKSDVVACALCVALPDAAIDNVGVAPIVTIGPVASLTDRLAGLPGGPAPPPPKIA